MHLYGLIIGIAIVIGINYFSRHQTIIPKNKENIFIIGLLFFSICSSRLYHVADQWNYYSQYPSQILATWNGGLGIYGAILGAILFIFLFSRHYKISFLKITDSVAPILPLCQALGRLGNFVNGEIPLWWFEAGLNLLLFFILKSKALKHYSSTALYLIGYGTIRLFFEFFRSDTWQINSLKIAQIISLVFILIGIFILRTDSHQV